MERSTDANSENKRVQDLLQRYLISRRIWRSSAAETSAHLDDDSLATFVEGNLAERELSPAVNHLVDCSFCLHKTAALMRLQLELDDANELNRVPDVSHPAKISTVLSDMFAKIFGTDDRAVFAHEEKDEPESPEKNGHER